MTILFSPSIIAFYTSEWEVDYIAASNWPEDLKEVSDEVYGEFSAQPPAGKKLGVVKGLPGWVNIPKNTPEQDIKLREEKKSFILITATQRISIWQTKLLMGRPLSDADKELLNIWMDYIDAVNAVDTSSDSAVWPQEPDE